MREFLKFFRGKSKSDQAKLREKQSELDELQQRFDVMSFFELLLMIIFRN